MPTDASVSFSACLIELEPMVRRFDEIDFLEAVLQIKKSKVSLVFNAFMGFLNGTGTDPMVCTETAVEVHEGKYL